MSLISVRKLLLVLTAGLILATGCAHTKTIKLKAVDVTSQQPLTGVLTVWRQDSAYNLLTGRRHETGPTNLLPSGADGFIVVAGVNSKMVSRFVFSQTDYESTYGIYNPETGTLKFGQKIDSRVSGPRFVLDVPYTNAVLQDGLFVIPIQRR